LTGQSGTNEKIQDAQAVHGVLRSNKYSPAQITALNQLIKRVPLNAGSGASSPCSFARSAMFSSLFAVLELGGVVLLSEELYRTVQKMSATSVTVKV